MSLYLDDVHDDPWYWQIWHRDDWVVTEYCEETGQHRSFPLELSVAPVKMVALIPQRPGLQPLYLPLSEGMRPIVFRARTATLVLNPDEEIPPARLFTGFGWQKTVGGENVQSLIALYDDGSQVVTDDRRKV